MKNTSRNLLAVLAVLILATRVSFAVPAPEIDPAMGTGALAFLAGAILVIRGRRKV